MLLLGHKQYLICIKCIWHLVLWIIYLAEQQTLSFGFNNEVILHSDMHGMLVCSVTCCILPSQGLTFISRRWNTEWLKQRLTVLSAVQSYTFVMVSVETIASVEMYISTSWLKEWGHTDNVDMTSENVCFVSWIDCLKFGPCCARALYTMWIVH